MEPKWCENIVIIQDRLRFWPSAETNILIALCVLGCFTFLIWFLFMKEDKGAWAGIIMIFISLFGLDGIYKATERNADIFMSDQAVELIGEVSGMEVEIEFNRNNGISPYSGTSGPIKFDVIKSKYYFGSFETQMPITTPFGHTLNRFSPSRFDAIWLKIGDQLVKSQVGDVGINLDNECDGRNCGLRAGDRVRVTVNTAGIEKRAHDSKLEDYYTKILRIERCDD